MNLIRPRVKEEILKELQEQFSKGNQIKRKIYKRTLVLVFSTTALFLIIFYLFYFNTNKATAYQFGLGSDYEKIISLNASISGNVPHAITNINTSNLTGDKRVIALYIFLLQYQSPMATPSVARAFVVNADKNGFGEKWYILPAIAGIESAFGRLIPLSPRGEPSYNAWGWSGGSRYGRWSFFNSWENAIEEVSKGFGEIYKDTNFVPEKMVARYCPPCALPEARGAWPRAVKQYSEEILEIYESLK